MMASTAGEQTVRLIFEGAETTTRPLIASMAMECGIAASILNASTRQVSGRTYGYMLLQIPGGPDQLAAAVKYLSTAQDVIVQLQAEYEAGEETT